jgi:ribosomal protein L29
MRYGGGMLKQFVDYIVGEWKVISQAPFTFVIASMFLCGLAYLAARWRYAISIEHLEHRVKLRDDEISDYKRKLEGASPDEAKARIQELRAELTEVRNQIRPRRLSVEQKHRIRNRLRMYPEMTGRLQLSRDVSCTDCEGLADDIAEAISDGGWEVERTTSMGGNL